MVAQDGAALLDVSQSRLTYQKADGNKTPCRYEKAQQHWTCDDGTVSDMTVAGLPFHGIVLIDFDNRRFSRKQR